MISYSTFHFIFGYVARSGIAVLYFNCFRKPHNVFKVSKPDYIPTNIVHWFNFLTNICYLWSFWWKSLWQVLSDISLWFWLSFFWWILIILSIVSCTNWPFAVFSCLEKKKKSLFRTYAHSLIGFFVFFFLSLSGCPTV